MILSEWLTYIEAQGVHAQKADLSALQTIAERLHLLPVHYQVITVKGTNGKGSTATACEQILKAHGYRVAAFTSPHLLRFNERIRIDGEELSDEILMDAFEIIERARKEIPLNYFQFIFLAALYCFSQARLDVAVLEVGIGGRLDAVNIIDADVALITNVGLDHQETLGETREAIGLEKAGIMRAHRPVVFGHPEVPGSVLQHAKTLKAPWSRVGKHYQYVRADATHWMWKSPNQYFEGLPTPKIALCNAGLAIMGLVSLKIPLRFDGLVRGLEAIHIPARIQTLQKHCEVIVDASHNVESMAHLARYLAKHPVTGKTRIVFSCLSDKDISGTMRAVSAAEWFLTALPIKRAAPLDVLKHTAQSLALSYRVFETVQAAYQEALAISAPEDRVVVCGSFYTAAAVLKIEESNQ